MTHLELPERYTSLRKHWRMVQTFAHDIEHFKIPLPEGHFTHVACFVDHDRMCYAAVSRTNIERDAYNRKVGLQIAVGRAMFAFLNDWGEGPYSGLPPFREAFAMRQGGVWDKFAVKKTLDGRALRDACCATLLRIDFLTQEEKELWKAKLKMVQPPPAQTQSPNSSKGARRDSSRHSSTEFDRTGLESLRPPSASMPAVVIPSTSLRHSTPKKRK